MSDHFNELTPAEAELIALLMEECGEVVQACAKILRHGIDSCHPYTGDINRDSLTKEIGDVRAAVALLICNDIIHSEEIERYTDLKLQSVQKWLHHATQ